MPQSFLTTTGTSPQAWTVPSDWNSANNSIEAIGPGGNGSSRQGNGRGGTGGGGGAYAGSTNVALTASTSVYYFLPAGGSNADAWFGDLNLLRQTSNFSAWSSVGALTFTTGQSDPLGGTGATKLIPTTANTEHYIADTTTGERASTYNGVQMNIAFYAKADGYTHLYVELANAAWSQSSFVVFNLANGTPPNNGGNYNTLNQVDIGTDAFATGAAGNGWYLCKITFTATSTQEITPVFYVHNGSTTSFAGNGTNGVLLFQPRLNYGAATRPFYNSTSTVGYAVKAAGGKNGTTSAAGAGGGGWGTSIGGTVYSGGSGYQPGSGVTTGGGGGGAAGNIGPGGPGAPSGGAGGSSNGDTILGSAGSVGGDGTEWGSYGSGAGGAGGTGVSGYAGGFYGGAGGGAGGNAAGNSGGAGRQALIVINYTAGGTNVSFTAPVAAITATARSADEQVLKSIAAVTATTNFGVIEENVLVEAAPATATATANDELQVPDQEIEPVAIFVDVNPPTGPPVEVLEEGGGPPPAPTPGLPVSTFLTATGLNAYTVPADWNSAVNKLEAIGTGGFGGKNPSVTTGGSAGSGGSGGGYARAYNTSNLTPGTNAYYFIAPPVVGNGTAQGDSWFNDLNLYDSQSFNNAVYTKSNVTAAPTTAITDPFGGTNASLLTDVSDTVSRLHTISTVATNGIDLPANFTFTVTYSIYVRPRFPAAGTAERFIKLAVEDGSRVHQANATFNPATGALISKNVIGTEWPLANISAGSEFVGRGWYRFYITAVHVGGATLRKYQATLYMVTNAGVEGYIGDGASGVYIFGAQSNYGPTLKPYVANIATTAPYQRYQILAKGGVNAITTSLASAQTGSYALDGSGAGTKLTAAPTASVGGVYSGGNGAARATSTGGGGGAAGGPLGVGGAASGSRGGHTAGNTTTGGAGGNPPAAGTTDTTTWGTTYGPGGGGGGATGNSGTANGGVGGFYGGAGGGSATRYAGANPATGRTGIIALYYTSAQHVNLLIEAATATTTARAPTFPTDINLAVERAFATTTARDAVETVAVTLPAAPTTATARDLTATLATNANATPEAAVATTTARAVTETVDVTLSAAPTTTTARAVAETTSFTLPAAPTTATARAAVSTVAITLDRAFVTVTARDAAEATSFTLPAAPATATARAVVETVAVTLDRAPLTSAARDVTITLSANTEVSAAPATIAATARDVAKTAAFTAPAAPITVTARDVVETVAVTLDRAPVAVTARDVAKTAAFTAPAAPVTVTARQPTVSVQVTAATAPIATVARALADSVAFTLPSAAASASAADTGKQVAVVADPATALVVARDASVSSASGASASVPPAIATTTARDAAETVTVTLASAGATATARDGSETAEETAQPATVVATARDATETVAVTLASASASTTARGLTVTAVENQPFTAGRSVMRAAYRVTYVVETGVNDYMRAGPIYVIETGRKDVTLILTPATATATARGELAQGETGVEAAGCAASAAELTPEVAAIVDPAVATASAASTEPSAAFQLPSAICTVSVGALTPRRDLSLPLECGQLSILGNAATLKFEHPDFAGFTAEVCVRWGRAADVATCWSAAAGEPARVDVSWEPTATVATCWGRAADVATTFDRAATVTTEWDKKAKVLVEWVDLRCKGC